MTLIIVNSVVLIFLCCLLIVGLLLGWLPEEKPILLAFELIMLLTASVLAFVAGFRALKGGKR